MRRVLFLAEHVTLAQVVRGVALARGLDPARWEAHFACASFAPMIFDGVRITRHPIDSVPRADVERAVAEGKRAYDEPTLARYVEQELALYRQVRPDVVVADLRFSASISAAVHGVPYVNLINAYWCPAARLSRFPVPEHPIVARVGVAVAERFFPIAMPQAFAHFARPVNVLRRRYGLSELGSLREMITYGDRVAFPDVPSIAPVAPVPPNARYIGPVLWSPALDAPPFVARARDAGRPVAYVTMGSSGPIDALPVSVAALRDAGFTVLVSTAGRMPPERLAGPHVHAAAMLPGSLAARAADVVVSSGGASTAHQALAEGKPVLAVPYNLDQYLSATALVDAGVALQVRAGKVSVPAIAAAASQLVGDGSFRERAAAVAREMAQVDPVAELDALLSEL